MAPLQQSKSADNNNNLQIQHFMHQHVLHKVYMTSEFNCNGCNTSGHGVRYQCAACDFDIHEQCATSCYRISSLLHPHHHLVLVNRPRGSHMCHVCKGLTNGLSYTCEIQTCEFNVHTLCIQIPPGGYNQHQQMQGVQTTTFGGYNSNSNSNNNSNSQPAVVMVNHQQQMQGMQMGGYNGVNTGQPVTVNHQQKQGIVTPAFGGITNNHQPVMVNQQQHMQGMQMGGYNGVNTGQLVMVNHQQKQGIVTPAFGGIINNHQPVMVNHHQQHGVQPTTFGGHQGMNNHQQMIPATTGFGGYQGGMNCQPVMVNHHQQQLQQQQQQQLMNIPIGDYSLVNNNTNQMLMYNQPPSTTTTNGYSKAGKIAANILSTSLIGFPIFNSRK